MTSRAGRVNQHREVCCGSLHRRKFAAFQPREVLDQPRLQVGPGRAQLRRLLGQRAVRNHHVDFRISQNVSDLGWLEKIIDRCDYRPGLQNAEQGWNEFRAILQPQRHTVAWFHAQRLLEMSGQAPGLREQRLV
jgi:hypothetical protein